MSPLGGPTPTSLRALTVALAAAALLAACSSDTPGGGTSDAGASAPDAGTIGNDDATVSGNDDATASGNDDATASGNDDATASAADDAAEPRDAEGPQDARPDVGFVIIDTGARDAGFFSPDTGVPPPPDSGVVVGRDAQGGPSDNGFVNGDALPLPDAVGFPDAAPFDGGVVIGMDAGGGGNSPDAGNRCTSSRDCIPNVETCGFLTVEANSVVLRCAPPNSLAGAGPVGATCANDSQCSSRLCLDGLSNECSLGCALDTDCPAGFACVGYTYNPGNVNVNLCSRACTDDTLCSPNGNVCQIQTYPVSGGFDLDLVCQAPQGTVPNGSPCTGGGDCRSGLCFTFTRVGVGCAACTAGEVCQGSDCVTQACSAICNDAADCAGAGRFTTCNPSVSLQLPNGTTRPITACTP